MLRRLSIIMILSVAGWRAVLSTNRFRPLRLPSSIVLGTLPLALFRMPESRSRRPTLRPELSAAPGDGIDVSTIVARQADGSVRVQFDTTGPTRGSGSSNRISQAYERRMGR